MNTRERLLSVLDQLYRQSELFPSHLMMLAETLGLHIESTQQTLPLLTLLNTHLDLTPTVYEYLHRENLESLEIRLAELGVELFTDKYLELPRLETKEWKNFDQELKHSHAIIVVMGWPGSGKTTLVQTLKALTLPYYYTTFEEDGILTASDLTFFNWAASVLTQITFDQSYQDYMVQKYGGKNKPLTPAENRQIDAALLKRVQAFLSLATRAQNPNQNVLVIEFPGGDRGDKTLQYLIENYQEKLMVLLNVGDPEIYDLSSALRTGILQATSMQEVEALIQQFKIEPGQNLSLILKQGLQSNDLALPLLQSIFRYMAPPEAIGRVRQQEIATARATATNYPKINTILETLSFYSICALNSEMVAAIARLQEADNNDTLLWTAYTYWKLVYQMKLDPQRLFPLVNYLRDQSWFDVPSPHKTSG